MKQIKLFYHSQMMTFHATMAKFHAQCGNGEKCRISWIRWRNSGKKIEKIILGGVL